MSKPVQFPYVRRQGGSGDGLAPMLPITLLDQHAVAAFGLLDSGAAVNVLPYWLGVQAGLDWQQPRESVKLSGNLESSDAKVVVLSAIVGDFPPARLGFAWCDRDDVPLLLGQINFFLTFDVCFFRSREVFEIRLK